MENVGNLQILRGVAIAEKVEEELKHLAEPNWDWKVKQVDRDNFIAVFPNKMLLETFSRSGSIELALHKISAKVTKSTTNPEVSVRLQTDWIRMFGIPTKAKTKEMVKLIAELAGEVICVDELSLIKDGPVRAKINARDISKIRGFVEIFIEKAGYEIRFLPEDSSTNKQAPKDPSQRRQDNDYEEEDDSTRDTELEWEKMRKQFESETHRGADGN